MTPRIIIEAVHPAEQRYDTLGDWFTDDQGNLVIRVSNSDGDVMAPQAFLVALHELVEVALCRSRGISEAAVDAFDMAYEGDGEPGDDPAAPYRREHGFASIVELMTARELGLHDYGTVTFSD